jgi:predicted DCC family thiol-disulfide oxidoreductase YuxK
VKVDIRFPSTDVPLLLYDERCSVCRRFVSLVVRADARGKLRIAPLQSPRGEALRRDHPQFAAKDSAVWVPPSGAPLGYSDAILEALAYLGGGWRVVAGLGRLIPRAVRDWAYRAFARNRRFFGWLGLDQLDPRSRARLLPDQADSP